MKFEFSTLSTVIFATLVAASSTRRRVTLAGQCDTGPVQCCQQVQSAGNPGAAALLSLLGIVVQNPNTPVGLNCSPATVVGPGADSCIGSSVCCKDNSHGGIIAIDCAPVSPGA